MLRYLAVKVSNVTTASQVVRMVVELHLLVRILVMEVVIGSFRRAIVTAELSCKREESELALSFPSAADNVF